MRIAGLKIRRFLGFLAALRASARESKSGWLRPVLKAAWQTLLGRRVVRNNWIRRMQACHRCPIYDLAQKRCQRGHLGCGCYMPLKARLPEATCWGNDNGLKIRGWKED